MSGLEILRTRLNYMGGKMQVGRMNEDKLRTLKRALLYSYQSATAILSDGRKFRCLINPEKIKTNYDNKYISIPFEDICLNEDEINKENDNKSTKKKTSEGIQKIDLKAGDVFTWAENNSDWIVYLQRLEETAYFRAEIRRCRYEVDVNGNKYKVYFAKNGNDKIDWRKVADVEWNELDYTSVMYITKNEETEAYFHRFTIIEINGKPWEVQAVDYNTDGIIAMYLREYFQNTIKEQIEQEKSEQQESQKPEIDEEELETLPAIDGPDSVYPYDVKVYTIRNAEGGKWVIDSPKGKIIAQSETEVKLQITTGRSGKLELKYVRENEEDIVLNITIKSL